MTSVVIPCYFLDQSYVDMTRNCIRTLRETSPNVEIIIVDDGSPFTPSPPLDGFYFTREVNGGYAAASSYGLLKTTGDIIIVANNDITFLPGWYEAIIKPLEMGYDISSIRTTDCDGWDTEDLITEGDKFGSLFAMTRNAYSQLRGLDKRFKGYFCDLDYRRKALNKGLKIAKNHAGLVEHEGKKTYKKTDPQDKEFIEMREVFIKKWGFLE